MLTLEIMKRLWPSGNQHVPGLLEGIVAAAPIVFPEYGMTAPLVIAHFMAQSSEECGAGLELVENDNFNAPQLLKLFPRHFTGSMADRYAHNPRMICDVAYGGRMLNAPPPSDDGYNFRGRGLTQCTGREGYQKLQAELQRRGCPIDIMTTPDLLCDPRYALLCGVADFVLCGCLPYAEKDDILEVTEKLNGGTNGLDIRKEWLVRWKAEIPALGASQASTPVSPAPKAPVPDPLPPVTLRAPGPIPPTSSAEDIVDRIRELLASLG